MKEKMIKAIKIILILMILYIPFVTIDCHRLYRKKLDSEAKPFITIREIKFETEYKRGTKYIGLGYSIEYYTEIAKVKDIFGEKEAILTKGRGADFRLFDKILIWGHGAS